MQTPTVPEAVPTTNPLTHRQILVIFSGLMLGMLLAALDQTIVATALPTIVGDLGGLDHLSWVVTSYLLAATVSTPIWGKLGDLLGRKRMYQVAILVFLVGSVLSGLSTSMAQLIAFRFVQGLGGGALIVLAQAIIADVVSPRERGRYQGYFGALFAASSVAGPLLGGFFTDHLSWRWVFYVNIPLGILALLVTSAVLPATGARARVVIDYLGAGLLAGAVSCIVLVTTWGGTQYPWTSPTIIGLSAAALALVGAFVVVERRAEEPLLPLRLFRGSIFSVSSGVSFVIGVAMFGSISFLPLFLQVVGGVSATNSGLLLVPYMLGMLGASVCAGQIVTRTGRYRVLPVTGTGIAVLGLALLSTHGQQHDPPPVRGLHDDPRDRARLEHAGAGPGHAELGQGERPRRGHVLGQLLPLGRWLGRRRHLRRPVQHPPDRRARRRGGRHPRHDHPAGHRRPSGRRQGGVHRRLRRRRSPTCSSSPCR